MSYVVLARKYRPMGFTDLVGQDHVARTLAGAIASGRVAHAFLFTGVRGVGKTTSARILAKALNCMGDPASAEPGVDPGPTAAPCLKCAACLEIADGKDVDVLEIDGASHSSVDDVRRLQDSLPYRPQRDRSKIVIVDEVHMLSTHAWNAFLKTLEEPPDHVKFIFATTEVHKVPVTILSRVQRFDFKLINTLQMVARLRHVLDQENIHAEEGALTIIAREAAGSMRDAMSKLDQVLAVGDAELTAHGVAEVLGVASHKVLSDIARSLVEGDAAACLETVAKVAERGNDIAHVTRDLLGLLRNLVVAKVISSPVGLLDLAQEELDDVLSLSKVADTDDLVRLHQGFSRGYDEVVRGAQPRASLEMLLVRLARRPPLLPLDDLIERLGSLERRLSGAGRGAAPQRGAGAPAPSRPRNREPRSASAGGLPTAERGDEPPAGPTAGPTAAAAAAATAGPTAAANDTPRSTVPRGNDVQRAREQDATPAQRAQPPRPPEPASVRAEASHAESPPSTPVSAPSASTPGSTLAAPHRDAAPHRAAPPPPINQASGSPSQRPRPGAAKPQKDAADVDLAEILERARKLPPPDPEHLKTLEMWAALLKPMRETRADLAAVLNHAMLLELGPERIRLGFDRHTVFRGRADSEESKDAILTCSVAVFGRQPELRFEFEQPDQSLHTVATLEAERRERERLQAIDRAKNHPLVKAAERLLEARVKRVLPYE